ncbi:hypothetical protein QQF64_021163 [Cirrhinus molitorella]|uniref:Uncharacterized protein n=1 Tax=Cirrhinus molitorella TaxID=172907 RepID=A0ABR3LF66_9TELE
MLPFHLLLCHPRHTHARCAVTVQFSETQGLLAQLSFHGIPLQPSIPPLSPSIPPFTWANAQRSAFAAYLSFPLWFLLTFLPYFLPSRWCISQPARHDQSSPDADWAIKVSNDRPLSVMGPAPVVKPCIKLAFPRSPLTPLNKPA